MSEQKEFYVYLVSNSRGRDDVVRGSKVFSTVEAANAEATKLNNSAWENGFDAVEDTFKLDYKAGDYFEVYHQPITYAVYITTPNGSTYSTDHTTTDKAACEREAETIRQALAPFGEWEVVVYSHNDDERI
jgi:hypothetical protein